MHWSHDSIPAMRLEARFGDRVVPAFCERPKSIWAMVSEAAARIRTARRLVCGARRMTCVRSRNNPHASPRDAEDGPASGDRVALLLGNRIEFVLAMFGAAHLGLGDGTAQHRQQSRRLRMCCQTAVPSS